MDLFIENIFDFENQYALIQNSLAFEKKILANEEIVNVSTHNPKNYKYNDSPDNDIEIYEFGNNNIFIVRQFDTEILGRYKFNNSNFANYNGKDEINNGTGI